MKNSNSGKNIWNYKIFIQVALFIITVSLIIYMCLQHFSMFVDFIHKVISILQPIIYGVVFAYLMSPICNFLYEKFFTLFEKKMTKEKAEKRAKGLSIGLSVIILILIILLFIMLILPQLITSISNFVSQLPQHIEDTRKFFERTIAFININLPNQYRQNLNDFFSSFSRNLMNLLPNVSSLLNNFSGYIYNVFLTIFNFIIGIIVTVYCLDNKKTFILQAKKITYAVFPKDYAATIIDTTNEANSIFLNFLVGKLIDSLIIGIICFIGVLILRMPYPILISTIIGVTNIIPFFGPFLGAIPCAIIILLENPIQSVYFLIFIFLLQQFDGNILGPKILGDTTGVTSFWVLFSILLFGGLWGVVGMIIGVPLFALIYNIIKVLVNKRLKEKGLPTKAYCYSSPGALDQEDKDKKEIIRENDKEE